MKYIRTKDGIIDTSIWEYDKYNKCWFNDKYKIVGGEYHQLIYKEDIVKQADTIEELCDEFVVDNWEEKNKPILCKYVKERNALYYCDENGINWLYIPDLLKMEIVIYASIWVDALLKPVAKMNEKGELVLL